MNQIISKEVKYTSPIFTVEHRVIEVDGKIIKRDVVIKKTPCFS